MSIVIMHVGLTFSTSLRCGVAIMNIVLIGRPLKIDFKIVAYLLACSYGEPCLHH